jgi:hypothetical protein
MAQSIPFDHGREREGSVLEQVQHDSDVVICRSRNKTPFVSELRVAKGLDVVALLEQSDDEDDDESATG